MVNGEITRKTIPSVIQSLTKTSQNEGGEIKVYFLKKDITIRNRKEVFRIINLYTQLKTGTL